MANKNDELKRKSRQTLAKEENDLKTRQAVLRARKEKLQDRREDLRDDLILAMKEEDETLQAVINKQLDEIRNDLKEINEEYKVNSDALENYSKVVKNKDEGKSSLVGTLFAGLGTGAAIWLGKKSLDKAYEADVEGTLVNKKSLDIFNKLNPLKMIHFKR